MTENSQPIQRKPGQKGNRRQGDNRSRPPREQSEFDQSIIDIARVTRVMAGGKRMRFRACLVIGDRKGRVGSAVAKGADVTQAVNKAFLKAKKNLISVPMVNETIPHQIQSKYGAAKVLLKPAPKGTGIIAGGSVRIILDLAGVSNIVAKILGSKSKINNVRATLKALSKLKKVQPKVRSDKKPEAKGTDNIKKESETKNKE